MELVNIFLVEYMALKTSLRIFISLGAYIIQEAILRSHIVSRIYFCEYICLVQGILRHIGQEDCNRKSLLGVESQERFLKNNLSHKSRFSRIYHSREFSPRSNSFTRNLSYVRIIHRTNSVSREPS